VLKSTVTPVKVTKTKIMSMLPTVARNYIVAAAFIVISWKIRCHYFSCYDTSSLSLSSSSSWFDVYQLMGDLGYILVLWFISQMWFWSAHRLVHSYAPLFQFVHAAHHRHYEPFALTAIDCSVSEMILLNMPAVLLPVLIVNPPPITHYLWMILAATHVTVTHSGHYVGHLADAYHAIHHRKCNCNYGSAILDRIFNTLVTE
jgi:sterol desaturase/sphingolipid hydroxylase (fatty acid hydroxylase superfamily)